MTVRVCFYSYFKELAGCAETQVELADGACVADLLAAVHGRYPRLAPMDRSTLVAVDVEYRRRGDRLEPGDEVSLFPPVQGG